MMRATLLSCSILVAGVSSQASAAPAARQRVVLADADPELRHAMEQALAPWHLEIVIDGTAPGDAASAQERADADTARFVVWRDGEQLVVFDRELGTLERRASRAGPLDPVAAATAALTIKTSMRLPPPPDAPPAVAVAAAEPSNPWVRIEVGLATRLARSDVTDLSARLSASVAVRPWTAQGWRFGLAGEAGTATSVSRASFKGTWQDPVVLGLISWGYARAAWEIEPQVGLGVRFSTLDGREANTARSETDDLLTARGGLAVRWHAGRWAVGAHAAIDASFGTPTYLRADTPAEVFQVPALAVLLGVQLAIER
ncbi:MAG: hypothetical protein ABIY55_32860 [Kofleriaceae bacterium]